MVLRKESEADRGLNQEVSEGRKDFNSNRDRGYACVILAKNLAAFCLCPKKLSGAKLKSHGLLSLLGKYQDCIALSM